MEYAQKVGLEDIHKFKDDVSRHVYAPLIEESLIGGVDSGVEGTPTFFINGVRYEDSFDLRTFYLKPYKSICLHKRYGNRNRNDK